MVADKEVLIIGGGVSGLGMAVQLKRFLGHDNFTLYEKSDNIGGTWWHNRYPACACDIPSHFYSYSFALKHDWTTTYPGRDELHAYFASVAQKYDIYSHCRFNTMCTGLEWSEHDALWTATFVNSVTGEEFVHRAPVVVSAIGTLDRPLIPKIKGAGDFKGTMFHSARWEKSFEAKNKNIVVLGNGASATQFVPELVREVGPRGQVTQLVRSAHWWTERGNPEYSWLFKFALGYIPLAARLYRIHLGWQLERVFYSFRMNASGARMRQQIRDATYRYIDEAAPAEYRDILRPDYEPGCKRRVNTKTYLASLHAPNMHLAKERAVRIGERHVETAEGGRYPADAIILATGFETQKWLHPLVVRGKGGQDLHEAWDAAGGAEAYKGTVVSGFPNLFILYGPNAATGQHSVIFHSECQINYTCRLLKPVLHKGSAARSIEVKAQAQRRDLGWVQGRVKELVFNSGCQSWWMDPVTKKNTFIYPDPMFLYWLRTIFPTWSDFVIEQDQARSPPNYGKAWGMLAGLSAVGCALLLGAGKESVDEFIALAKNKMIM